MLSYTNLEIVPQNLPPLKTKEYHSLPRSVGEDGNQRPSSIETGISNLTLIQKPCSHLCTFIGTECSLFLFFIGLIVL